MNSGRGAQSRSSVTFAAARERGGGRHALELI